jgi:nucleotidyltransferase substrate binding protein (TIGR01987 family)
MNDENAAQKLANLERAVERLGEALQASPDDPLSIDGTIQRFEFVFELFWKTLRRLLAADGIQVGTPRETLKKAFSARWIGDEEIWLQMLADRNQTSHVYDEQTARQIYGNIRSYQPLLEQALTELKQRSG